MRRLIYIFISLLAVMACSEGKGTPEEEALKAATKYYEYLLNGKYDKFAAGVNGIDSMPDDYKRQIEGSAKMFMDVHEKRNKGIIKVSGIKAERDTANDFTCAFLMITLGDSVNEQIVVPMVERNGVWKMD